MKPYHKNPRTITESEQADLAQWLDELGDLSGIVHELNSDEVICGNQRVDVMGLLDASPIITERFDPPTRQGTVASGYYEKHGERYAYRAVRWTEKQSEKANIVANSAGGDWDIEMLGDWDSEELAEWGMDEETLAEILASAEEQQPPAPKAQARQTLAERFVVPPFSVLDARQGYWQERKRAWIALGIQSEVGRGGGNTARCFGQDLIKGENPNFG